MRRTLTRLRLARLSGGVLTILLGLAAPLTAQTGSAPDASRLARFVPAEKLELYAEFSGLDAHKEAWQKTAAYRMLNETTLGAMLEEVGAQLAEAGMAQRPDRRLTGAEVVTIVKHLARHGFVFAGNDHTDAPKTTCAVLVIAKGARKDVRPIFSRLMLAAGGPNSKPELGKRGGRAIVLMKGSKPASQWAWWAEGEDLVVALDRPESVDIIGEVIDKKRPNALEDPTRAELAKTEDGFEPVALAFVGGAIWTDPKLAGPLQKAEVRGIERLDYRWGFHDDALMNVTRIVAPTPHQGLLALLDQPKFDAKTLPPLPDGLKGFTVASLDLAKTFDAVTSVAKSVNPAFAASLERGVQTFRTKTRLQLQKDVLGHLGPKVAFFTAPTPPSASSKGAASKAAAPPGATAGSSLMALAAGQVPRYTLAIEVDDAAAFGKSLDALMIFANQQVRAAMTPAGAPAGAEAAPMPEFKMMPGQAKSFVLNVPAEVAKLPPGVRPTIRLGSKSVVISTTPESARQVAELKKGAPDLPADLQAVLGHVPSDLLFLSVGDPRDTMPQTLAALPGILQAGVNGALLKMQTQQGGATKPGTAPAMLQLRIDPARLPAPDALKALLFPGSTAFVSDDRGVRIVTREAFPNLVAPTNFMVMGAALPAIQAARKAAAAAAARGAAGAGAGGATQPNPSGSRETPRDR